MRRNKKNSLIYLFNKYVVSFFCNYIIILLNNYYILIFMLSSLYDLCYLSFVNNVVR